MFTTVNEHKPLEYFVEWLYTDTLRDEARLVKALNFDHCRQNIRELVLATMRLHEQEKGRDSPFSSHVVAGATGHVKRVEQAIGIRTYGDEKVGSNITAIRVLGELLIANGSRSRREHIISVAPENPGNGVVLFVERSGHSLKYSISIQGELLFQCQTICDGICTLFLAQYATNILYKAGSELFGFLLDTHFMDWEQTDSYNQRTRSLYSKFRGCWVKISSKKLAVMRAKPTVRNSK